MQCPYPVSIRNPRLNQVVTTTFSDGTIVGLGGEVIEPRIQVPCGRCVVCQNNRREEWAARMELESRTAVATYFCTLTYSDEYCPDELMVSDLQKFFKRLRKKVKCRYFACGEYGDQFQRPHYHFILWLDLFYDRVCIERFVSDSWRFGFIQVRQAERSAYRYCAKYVVKSVRNNPDNKQAPFAIMSRKPGISFRYFDSIKDFNREFILLENGSRASLPRYLLGKLDPVEQIAIKRDRQSYATSGEQVSDIVKQLRAINLDRRLYRQYVLKYGK